MEKKVLKYALFGAFLICLYVSIPHLAWVFWSWDQGGASDSEVTILWVIHTSQEWSNAYLQAITIDGVIAFASYTLTNRKGISSKGLGYTFIGCLIMLSWLFNWVFAKAHAPIDTGVNSVWTGTILSIPLLWLAPIIVSSPPLFAFAFTVMIDKLTGDVISATELEEKLKEKQQITNIRKQYAGTDDGLFADALKRRIDSVAGVGTHLKKTIVPVKKTDTESTPTEQKTEKKTDKGRTLWGRFKGQKATVIETSSDTPTEQSTDTERTTDEQITERDTDKLRILDVQDPDNSTDTERTTDEQEADTARTLDELDPDNFTDNSTDTLATQTDSVKRPNKPLYISLNDAVSSSGYSQEYLTRLASSGKVRTKKSDSKKLLRTSFEAYLLEHGRQLNGESEESTGDSVNTLTLVK